ncbi:MAG: hypothetical protein MI747_24870, partial [Desulfobacterales bacterium]|nr:hypothetical protein [Desulfobacterales bacterium]
RFSLEGRRVLETLWEQQSLQMDPQTQLRYELSSDRLGFLNETASPPTPAQSESDGEGSYTNTPREGEYFSSYTFHSQDLDIGEQSGLEQLAEELEAWIAKGENVPGYDDFIIRGIRTNFVLPLSEGENPLTEDVEDPTDPLTYGEISITETRGPDGRLAAVSVVKHTAVDEGDITHDLRLIAADPYTQLPGVDRAALPAGERPWLGGASANLQEVTRDLAAQYPGEGLVTTPVSEPSARLMLGNYFTPEDSPLLGETYDSETFGDAQLSQGRRRFGETRRAVSDLENEFTEFLEENPDTSQELSQLQEELDARDLEVEQALSEDRTDIAEELLHPDILDEWTVRFSDIVEDVRGGVGDEEFSSSSTVSLDRFDNPPRTALPDLWEAPEGFQVDRFGFEHEFQNMHVTVPSWLNEVQLEKGYTFAVTSGNELGYPVLSLEVDSNGREGYYLELVTGPQTGDVYLKPEYFEALRIMQRVFYDTTRGRTLQRLIDIYNEDLRARLGDGAAPYELHSDNPTLTEEILVRRPPVERVNIQTNVMLPYGKLGGEEFRNSLLAQGQAGTSADGANPIVDTILDEMGVSPETVRPEFRAFLFQVVFQELFILNSGGQILSKTEFDLILRLSPEDALFSILTDEEVTRIKDWYEEPGRADALESRIIDAAREGVDTTEGLGQRLEKVFHTSVDLRLENGSGALGPDSQVRLPSGDTLTHTHQSPNSRRPVLEVDGKAYFVAEYRAVTDEIQKLGREALYWVERNGADHIRALVPELGDMSGYDRAAAEYARAVRNGLAQFQSDGFDRDEFMTWVEELGNDLAGSDGVLDDSGRVPESSLGWWRQVHRSTGDAARYALENGLKSDPVFITFLEHVENGF